MTYAAKHGTFVSEAGLESDRVQTVDPVCATPASGVWRCTELGSEATLVERMTLRDEAAWREFMQRYGALVRSVIERTTRRFPSLVSSWEVEEIFAAFLHGLLGRDMYKLRMFDAQRGTRLSTWIGLLATNATWDHIRRAARRRPGAAEHGEAAASGPDPLAELVAKEAVLSLRTALDSLSARDRVFVDLYYLRGMSPEQIGSALNISIKTVYSKKHKITLRLQSGRRPKH